MGIRFGSFASQAKANATRRFEDDERVNRPLRTPANGHCQRSTGKFVLAYSRVSTSANAQCRNP